MTYQKPNPISFLEEEFPVGLIVENFGYRAHVIGYHVGAKMLIVENEEIGKWLADPMKCTVPIQKPVREGQTPMLM